MASDKIQQLTDASFDSIVKQATKPVLVDFWAEWCGPCKALGPVLDELVNEIGDKALITKLNVDENRTTAAAYKIQAIPALLIFKNGQVVETIVGFTSKDILKQKLQAHL